MLGCCAGDYKLISKLVNIFNCGRVSENSNNSGVEFMVNRLSDINEIIIPLFQKYNLISIKNRDFEDFCKIVLRSAQARAGLLRCRINEK